MFWQLKPNTSICEPMAGVLLSGNMWHGFKVDLWMVGMDIEKQLTEYIMVSNGENIYLT